jgi:hypothetical protein
MLTEVKNNYKSILKHFDFDESVSFADHKKQKLIEMANKKEAKPGRKTRLGQALRNYMNKNGNSYCPKFDKAIRKLAPNWFASTSQIMKDKLIQMARSKEPRPTQKTKEGIALSDYTKKSSSSYCPDFNKRIRKLVPNWFISITQIADHMKRKLIQRARSKQPRPSDKTKEGRSLFNYTSKSRNSSYCPEFDKTIRKLAPNWFRNRKCSPK